VSCGDPYFCFSNETLFTTNYSVDDFYENGYVSNSKCILYTLTHIFKYDCDVIVYLPKMKGSGISCTHKRIIFKVLCTFVYRQLLR